MKQKGKKQVHRDKQGREFIKQIYFVRGKMKFTKIYVIEGIPADEFYKNNATDLDLYLNGDFELITDPEDIIYFPKEKSKNKSVLPYNENFNDLPF